MGIKLKNLKNHFFDSPKKKILSVVTVVAIGAVTYLAIAYKPVKIEISGKVIDTATLTWTVQDVLEKNNIVLDSKDKIEPALDSKISKNEVIKITKAQNVVLLVDGKEKKFKTAEASIGDMLKAENIKYDDNDRVEPAVDSKIVKDQKIEVVRVEEEVVKETENIGFETTVKKNDKLDKSVTKTVQDGQDGEKEITAKIVYENGKEVGRHIVSEKVLKEPIAKVVEQGTMQTVVLSRGTSSSTASTGSTNLSGTSNSSGAGESSGKKTMTMQSTAYYTGTVTATGTAPRRNPNGLSTVAVDPRVIPLGSKLYISGYGYAVAEDTGGAVKNNIIDVFLNSYDECMSWGRRNVEVTIVAYPGQW